MKRSLCLLLVILMSLSFCACGKSEASNETAAANQGSEEKANSQLQIGFAKVNTTPSYSVTLIGSSVNGDRYSNGIISYLFATCVAAKYGDEIYLLFTVDLLSLGDAMIQTLRDEITAAVPDVKSINIFFGATHAHNAPMYYQSGNTPEGKYRGEFINNIVTAAKLAVKDLTPATMEVCKFQLEGMNFIRHYEMNDGTYAGSNFGSTASGYKAHAYEANNEMILVNFPREGKEPVMLVNWAAHPADPYDPAIGYLSICSDHPGWCRDKLEELTGAKVAYFNGASGDVVPKSAIAEVNHGLNAKEYGIKLAEMAYEHIGELKPVEVDAICATGESVTVNVEHEMEHLLAQCQEIAQMPAQGMRTEADIMARSLGLTSYHHASAIVSRSKKGATEQREINVLRIGPVSFTTGTYEMASQHAEELKAASPFEFTFQICSNSSYIPREEAIDYYSYEGNTRAYTRETGDMLVQKYVELLNTIK